MNDIAGRVPENEAGYKLRISRLTVDKLGVKLYDKVSAVVAELVANAYDADAEVVQVRVPLGTELAARDDPEGGDHGWVIEVRDDGHGMTPEEARRFYLQVGRDRRAHNEQGSRSREKGRAVMGRKGIGKLAPFGICKRIEVISSGGDRDEAGYLTSHFFMDFDEILSDSDEPVALEAGDQDQTYRETRGTTIRLSGFLPKRVPPREVFERQLARRFAVAEDAMRIIIEDTRRPEDPPFPIPAFQVPAMEESVINLAERPVVLDDGRELPVAGWVGLAKDAYKNEEMAGVRIYARGKIVATTRDFEQPAGYTGEFTTRSYLVGEVHADWLDADDGEDLIRTDRQDIIWDSELGGGLRQWGAELIKEVGARSRAPRRARVQAIFLERSNLEQIARGRFVDEEVIAVALDLGRKVGAFAAEDELEDEEYVAGLREVIISVAPHRALIEAFQRFSGEVLGQETALETLEDLFGKTRVAEMASYSQIAAERVRAIKELDETLANAEAANESTLQRIIANAPYLVDPTWTVITQNQALKTFKTHFEAYWKRATGADVVLAIEYEQKRPDFVLVNVGNRLHIVEIKAPRHIFNDSDFERLHRYAEAFEGFAAENEALMRQFPEGWRIDLVADDVNLKPIAQRAFEKLEGDGKLKRSSWVDFLTRAKTSHEQFLDVHERLHTAADDEAPA